MTPPRGNNFLTHLNEIGNLSKPVNVRTRPNNLMTQQLPRTIIPINTDPAFQPKGHCYSTALPAHIKILRYIDVPILGKWDWQLLTECYC